MSESGLVGKIRELLKPKPPEQLMPQTILPEIAAREIRSGRLPQINTNTIFLASGERCHFIDRAVLIQEKFMVTGYEGGNSGWSYRIFRGLTYRTGKRKGRLVRDRVQEKTKGYLYLTNKRIIFVANTNGIDKKINNITAIMPYSNALSIQMGNTSFTFLLPSPDLALGALSLITR